MTTLSQIRIKGFKSIQSLEGLNLGPVNVLIRANGAGKSNLISCFEGKRRVLWSTSGLGMEVCG